MPKLFALPISVYDYNNKFKYYVTPVCSIKQHTVTDCSVQLKQGFAFQCENKVIGLD